MFHVLIIAHRNFYIKYVIFQTMEISYVGHSCFKAKGKGVSLVFDPYDPEKVGFKIPKLEADIVCVSHEHDDHNYVGVVNSPDSGKEPFVIRGPGEYEMKGVNIQGFGTFHDEKEGQERGKNTIYYVEMEGMFLLHLGDLGHFPDKKVLEELETVHVLFVPVGGVYTIDYKVASEIVSELEPYFVIPMHYRNEKLKLSKAESMDSIDKFLSEWGSDVVRHEQKLKISGKNDLPEETQVVVLEAS